MFSSLVLVHMSTATTTISTSTSNNKYNVSNKHKLKKWVENKNWRAVSWWNRGNHNNLKYKKRPSVSQHLNVFFFPLIVLAKSRCIHQMETSHPLKLAEREWFNKSAHQLIIFLSGFSWAGWRVKMNRWTVLTSLTSHTRNLCDEYR